MDAGKVNGWWVVATAAILIGYDLMTGPALQTSAFLAVAFVITPLVFLLWWVGKDPE